MLTKEMKVTSIMNTASLKLVRKAATGSKEAFEKLIIMHQEYLYKTAYLYTKNEQDALDAVQECAMRAMISMDKLREPAYFKTWITRILINCIYLEKKKNSRTYAGIYRIDILDIVSHDDALKETYTSLDSFDMDYTINQIIGDKADPEPLDMHGKTESDLEAMSDEEWRTFMHEITPADRNQFPNKYENWWFDGPFSFHLHIEIDREGRQVVTVDEMNDTGAGLYQVVKTKFEITVEKKCSEDRIQNGVVLVVLDAEGNLLPRGNSVYGTYAINGRDVSKIYVYVCDYTEYMEDLSKYQNDADFKQILEKRALYSKEIIF